MQGTIEGLATRRTWGEGTRMNSDGVERRHEAEAHTPTRAEDDEEEWGEKQVEMEEEENARHGDDEAETETRWTFEGGLRGCLLFFTFRSFEVRARERGLSKPCSSGK